MFKLDRIALKLLAITFFLTALAWIMLTFTSSFMTKTAPTQRTTYQNITNIEIRYPANNALAVYKIEQHSKTIQAIVDDINSLSYGKWRESFSGKEGASTVSIYLYNHADTLVASFSLYPETLHERAADYRQLNVQGFYREIEIRQLPALKAVWYDSKNVNDHNLLLRSKYCNS